METWKHFNVHYPDMGPIDSEPEEVQLNRHNYNMNHLFEYCEANPYVLQLSYPCSGRNWVQDIIEKLTGVLPTEATEINIGNYADYPYLSTHSIKSECMGGLAKALMGQLDLVYILRDPRDVCRSFIYKQAFDNAELLSYEMCEALITMVIRQWRNHLVFFIKLCPFLIQYEHLCLDPIVVIERLLEFAGIKANIPVEKAIAKIDQIATHNLIPVSGGVTVHRTAEYATFVTHQERYEDHCCHWKRDAFFLDKFADRIWDELGDMMLDYGYGKDGYEPDYCDTEL